MDEWNDATTYIAMIADGDYRPVDNDKDPTDEDHQRAVMANGAVRNQVREDYGCKIEGPPHPEPDDTEGTIRVLVTDRYMTASNEDKPLNDMFDWYGDLHDRAKEADARSSQYASSRLMLSVLDTRIPTVPAQEWLPMESAEPLDDPWYIPLNKVGTNSVDDDDLEKHLETLAAHNRTSLWNVMIYRDLKTSRPIKSRLWAMVWI